MSAVLLGVWDPRILLVCAQVFWCIFIAFAPGTLDFGLSCRCVLENLPLQHRNLFTFRVKVILSCGQQLEKQSEQQEPLLHKFTKKKMTGLAVSIAFALTAPIQNRKLLV